jgi:tetratricopeptide (TPR) repeat protein
MFRVTSVAKMDDRQLNRWIKRVALILVVGIPLFVGLYWMDRHVDPGLPMADRAIAAAEANVRANPEDLSARNNLAATYVSAKRYADGITQFSQVLASDPSYRAAILGRGIAYLDSGQLDLARADLQSFVDKNGTGEFAKTDPQLEHAYYELGVVQLQKGDAADAVATLQKALAIDGGDADALFSLGQALNKTGDPTKAVSALKLAVAFVPTGWCDPYLELEASYASLKQADGVAWATGMSAFCSGKLTDAVAALKPLTNGPMKTDALLGLGYVAAQDGDNTTAAGYFNQVLAADPTNQSASIALSSIGAKASAAPSATAYPTPEGSN